VVPFIGDADSQKNQYQELRIGLSIKQLIGFVQAHLVLDNFSVLQIDGVVILNNLTSHYQKRTSLPLNSLAMDMPVLTISVLGSSQFSKQ
jgi:hypothetical protein